MTDVRIERIRPEDESEKIKDVGWVVRREGKPDAYFPDATYEGDLEASFHAAQAWCAAGTPPGEDLKNITRIEVEEERETGWTVTFESGGGHAPERFAVEEGEAPKVAFERAVERLEEVAEGVAIFEEVRLEVGEEEAVLRGEEGEPVAKAQPYEKVTRSEVRGYQVRFMRQKKWYSKFFRDELLGGEEGALKAAQYWRAVKKGEVPRGAEGRPAAIAGLPATKGDLPERAAVERSQFGVPGMRVVMVKRPGERREAHLVARYPKGGGRYARRRVSIEKKGVEGATMELCTKLVKARRKSEATEEELANVTTPFALVAGWFADKSGMSVEEEAGELCRAVLPRVREAAKERMREEGRLRQGIPGLSAVIKRSAAGRYAAFLSVRWRGPSGEAEREEAEVVWPRGGEDEAGAEAGGPAAGEEEGAEELAAVDEALERLARALLVRYNEYEETWELRRDERSPFSVLSRSQNPETQLRRLVKVGQRAARAAYLAAVQGTAGVRVAQGEWRDEETGRGGEYVTVEVSWPSGADQRQRRLKSFEGMGDLRSALKDAVVRGLEALATGEAKDPVRAVGEGSPFEGVVLKELESAEGLEKHAERIVRKALPALRLEYQREHLEPLAATG